MDWHELGRIRSGFVAPAFALTSGAGETVTREQFRQRCHLVLYFTPLTAAPAAGPLAGLLAGRSADFAEASARVYLVDGQGAALSSPLLLADPGNSVRAAYARVFPEGKEPGADDPFALVLDRYGKPWYAGRGAIDEAAVDEALTKLWAIEYDCPE